MPLSEEQRALYQARLDEARAALHQLQLGQAVVNLAYNGESVSYSAANVGQLRQYIRELETTLGQRSSARARSRGVVFG